jgi:hypothetical protein
LRMLTFDDVHTYCLLSELGTHAFFALSRSRSLKSAGVQRKKSAKKSESADRKRKTLFLSLPRAELEARCREVYVCMYVCEGIYIDTRGRKETGSAKASYERE